MLIVNDIFVASTNFTFDAVRVSLVKVVFGDKNTFI